MEWNALLLHKILVQKKNHLNVHGVFSRHSFAHKFHCPFVWICPGLWADEIFVSLTSQHEIKVFNRQGKLIKSFGSCEEGIGQFFFQRAICVSGSEVFVFDSENNRIQIFDQDYKPIRSISTGFANSCAICVSKQGNILLANVHRYITVLNQEGRLIKIIGSLGVKDSPFVSIDDICINSRDEIIVVEQYVHRVQIFNQDGLFLQSFGSCGNYPEQFFHPRAICVDRQDNILVADEQNYRISIFNSRGVPIRQIRTLGPPTKICVWGRKIVTTESSTTGKDGPIRIKIYK